MVKLLFLQSTQNLKFQKGGLNSCSLLRDFNLPWRYKMSRKNKRLAERRAASKSIRSTARKILHDLMTDPEKIWDDRSLNLYPWWEGKKIGQAQIVIRNR